MGIKTSELLKAKQRFLKLVSTSVKDGTLLDLRAGKLGGIRDLVSEPSINEAEDHEVIRQRGLL